MLRVCLSIDSICQFILVVQRLVVPRSLACALKPSANSSNSGPRINPPAPDAAFLLWPVCAAQCGGRNRARQLAMCTLTVHRPPIDIRSRAVGKLRSQELTPCTRRPVTIKSQRPRLISLKLSSPLAVRPSAAIAGAASRCHQPRFQTCTLRACLARGRS